MLLLIPGLSSIGDLRQQGPDSFNVFLTPQANPHCPDELRFRCRNLSGLDIARQSGHTDSQLFGDLMSGELRHSGQIVPDS